MRRWLVIVTAAALWAVGCGGDEEEITGVCLYDDEPRPAACRNLWDGDESCPDEDGVTGISRSDTSCSEEGYPAPCTHDHPSSLWVADEDQCGDWEDTAS